MRSHIGPSLRALRLPAFESAEAREAFWAREDESKLPFRKFFLFVAILTFTAIGTLDALAGGEAALMLLGVRSVTAAVLIVLYFEYCKDCSPSRRDNLIHVFGSCVGLSIIIMTLIAPRPAADFYPFLLSATMVFGSALVMPRFSTLAWQCATANLLYWPTTAFSATSTPAFYANMFVMTVTSFAVVIGAYTREKLEREQAIYQTRLAAAREEAVLSRDEALQANRAKSHLLANVSHELRTPMNAILGFSEIMQHEMFGPIEQAQYRDYLNDIHQSGMLLQSSIDDLLDISRLEVDKMSWDESWVYLDGVIERAIQTCKLDTAAAGIRVTHRIDTNATTMLCDPERMTQILINLITNAVKFSERGTTISITAGAQPSWYSLSVSDEGCGIPADALERICEPFGQATSDSYNTKKGGLGLGLAIVRGLVRKFDGLMQIDSVEGQGTTVSLLIPTDRIASRKRARVTVVDPSRRKRAVSA